MVLVVDDPVRGVVAVVVDAERPVVVEVVVEPAPGPADPLWCPTYPLGVGAGRTTR